MDAVVIGDQNAHQASADLGLAVHVGLQRRREWRQLPSGCW